MSEVTHHARPAHGAQLLRPQVRELPAYNSGTPESLVRAKYGLSRVTKLASNENPFGSPPAVLEALRQSISQTHLYPDPRCTALRERIEQLTGVSARRVVCGNGSEDVIEMLCKAVLSPGDRVVTLAPSFGLHEIFPLMMGAIVAKVPITNTFEYDLPAWRAALSRPVKMVIFSTPSNPVGCALNAAQFSELIGAAPEEAVLVIDEAYYEYAAGPDYADSLKLLSAQNRPWIVLRTLSKAYGLAALRVGYGMASDEELIDGLDRVRTPFNVNGFAQAAALAALSDPTHMLSAVAATRKERRALYEQLIALEHMRGYGLRVAPSQGNFLLVQTRGPSCAAAQGLMQQGVIIKPWTEPGFERFLRVTVGRAGENEHFVRTLDAWLASQ